MAQFGIFLKGLSFSHTAPSDSTVVGQKSLFFFNCLFTKFYSVRIVLYGVIPVRSVIQPTNELTWVNTADGAPTVLHGDTPQEAIPTRTSFGDDPWTNGPPKSPLQAANAPVKGPVHIFVVSLSLPLEPTALIALLQSLIEIGNRVAFCKIFAAIPMFPHPAKVAGPTGTAWGWGNLIARTRSRKTIAVFSRI